jgi:transposase
LEAILEKAIRLFVGIDVGKHKLDVHVHPTEEKFTVGTDDDGLRSVVERLRERAPQRIVLESTGGYCRRVVAALEAAQLKVHCVPAHRVRKFAQAIGMNAKTDALDAEVIARFAESARLVDKVTLSAPAQRLRDLITRRAQLVALRARDKNHKETMPSELLGSWLAVKVALDKHIDELDQMIEAVIRSDPELAKRDEVLRTIKGCGPISRAAFLSMMPELGTLTSKQAAALVGVAPFNRESADSDKPRSIKGGRRRLRCVLYMAATAAARHNGDIHAIYERLLQKSKPPKVALVAALRKLVVIANARMRDALRPSTIVRKRLV